MILPHHHHHPTINDVLEVDPQGQEQIDVPNDIDDDRQNHSTIRSRLKACFNIRLSEFAGNDKWMVCYCLVITVLEGWVFPFLADDLLKEYSPIQPTDDYPAIIMIP
jgi:hypothetical protein